MSREYRAWLTSHELVLLALYRALSESRRRGVDGLAYRAYLSDGAGPLADQGLSVEHLPASTLRPFVEAAGGTSGRTTTPPVEHPARTPPAACGRTSGTGR